MTPKECHTQRLEASMMILAQRDGTLSIHNVQVDSAELMRRNGL